MTHTPDTSDARLERLERIAAQNGGDPEPLTVPVHDLLTLVLAVRERDALLAEKLTPATAGIAPGEED